MRRLLFAIGSYGTFAAAAAAQDVPGRDLLYFPIGTIAEAPALADGSGDGLWNPAVVLLAPKDRFRVGVGTMTTPADQGVSAQFLAVAAALPDRTTLGLSVTRAAVADIIRTETDPQTTGSDVPYNTFVISALAARRTYSHLITGVAARVRTGSLDGDRRSAVGLDGGVVADDLLGRAVRFGASTFLWQPADGSAHTTFNLAADGRVVGPDERQEVRAGYAFGLTEGVMREHYLFASARAGIGEVRAGLARSVAYGQSDTRMRLGVGLRYARYRLGIGRDENGAGLEPIYQFTLSSTLQ